MKILTILICAGIIGFALLMTFAFITGFSKDIENFINNFFFKDLFTLSISCIVIGLPFSLYYFRNKNID